MCSECKCGFWRGLQWFLLTAQVTKEQYFRGPLSKKASLSMGCHCGRICAFPGSKIGKSWGTVMSSYKTNKYHQRSLLQLHFSRLNECLWL